MMKHIFVAMSFEQIRTHGSLESFMKHLADNRVRGIKVCKTGNTAVASANGSHWNQFGMRRAWQIAVHGMEEGAAEQFLTVGWLFRRAIRRLMAPDSSSADHMVIGQMFNTLLNVGVAMLGDVFVKPGMLDLCHGAPLFVEGTRAERLALGIERDIPAWWGRGSCSPPLPSTFHRVVLHTQFDIKCPRPPSPRNPDATIMHPADCFLTAYTSHSGPLASILSLVARAAHTVRGAMCKTLAPATGSRAAANTSTHSPRPSCEGRAAAGRGASGPSQRPTAPTPTPRPPAVPARPPASLLEWTS